MANLPAVHDQFAAAKTNALDTLGTQILAIAEAANAAIMAMPPKPVGYIRTIFPNNLIVYEYQRSDLVLEFALATLRALSPRLTGSYQEAHTVFISGQSVQPPYRILANDDVAISNPEPYARKIEIGRMHMTVPGSDHVYQQAQQIIERQYAGVMNVEFTWRSLSTAGGSPHIVRKKKGRTHEHALQSQPTLVFHPVAQPSQSLLSSGIKLLS